MKRVSKWAALALTIAMLFAMAGPASAAFDQEVLEGIVMIQEGAPDSSGVMHYWRGTGFFIGTPGENPQYIVTNCHVVEEFILAGKALGGGELIAVFDKDDQEEAYLVDYDYEKDVAVLRLSEPTGKRSALRLKAPANDMLSAPVYAVGYPLAADLTVQAVTSFNKTDATVTTGSITRFLTESGTGRKLIQTDASLSGGNSGGPLSDDSGAVIGINTAGSGLDQNLFYAVSTSEILPLLDRNSITYTLDTGKKDNTTLYAAAGGAAVVLVIILVLISRSKKKKKAQPVTQAAPVQPAGTGTPYLPLHGPQHGGMAVQLYRQPVQLGRDAATCRLVYQDGTPGVSSKHCQVFYDEQERLFVITDLNSTYGTFLANGQRIAPNTPVKLPPRSSIYLGEADNTVYLDLE